MTFQPYLHLAVGQNTLLSLRMWNVKPLQVACFAQPSPPPASDRFLLPCHSCQSCLDPCKALRRSYTLLVVTLVVRPLA